MKKALLMVVIISFIATDSISAQPERSRIDRALVEQTIANWDKAWQTKDFKLAARDYSDDADWTNAFGMKRKGHAEIQKALAEVFALPFVMAGQSKAVEQTVKFIKPDVALAITRVERLGQQVPSGTVLGTKQVIYESYVKSKGQWKIISHLISDARNTEQTKH